jgi:hypothetical protein
MKAKEQTTMAIIMGRGGLPLEGNFIVAAKLLGRSKRMNLWRNRMMRTCCRGLFLRGF